MSWRHPNITPDIDLKRKILTCKAHITSTSQVLVREVIISYFINTTKYWLPAIFKENELASSPLILHKVNYFLVLMQQLFYRMAESFCSVAQ